MKYRITLLLILIGFSALADNGYRLWLKYDLLPVGVKAIYAKQIKYIHIVAASPTIRAAEQELKTAISGLVGHQISEQAKLIDGTILLVKSSDLKKYNVSIADVPENPEGYLVKTASINGKKIILITSKTDIGVLYGSFAFIKQLQLQQEIGKLNVKSEPKIRNRILNHWDNLDRTVERGYAGFSLWNWQTLPGYIDQRYIDYARANASVGINGTVLNNVNANALILTKDWLLKVKALADAFRPYCIKVYLTARFSAPIEIGGLKTADPLDKEVINWWKEKADEIYNVIPDFGGYLVKANSEGQPGPQNYNRNHADGANMLAKSLAPHGGIVMWRAFVYDNKVPDDRAKQAYNEFKPLDGNFDENVIIQVKNGAIDFQPREPFHPLFGAMPNTSTMLEFQLTQEYLGMSTNLVYLATLFKETLGADTYAKGQGSTVAKVINGSLYGNKNSAIAGVANIGSDVNWCGHPFAQSNWYAFGKLAWNDESPATLIADEWLKMTFRTDFATINKLNEVMMRSRETVVDYMTPLGLHHIMGWDHHYGPGPWIKDKPRADWTSVYYHQADKNGIGFNRTNTGSNALAQYFPAVAEKFSNLNACPEEYLLWFHHLPWNYKLKSGDNLWDGMVKRYYKGAAEVKQMQATWDSCEKQIDPAIYRQVKQLLAIQYDEAVWWRNACVLYFQSKSGLPIPSGLPKPEHDLAYYEKLEFKFVPGI